MSEMRRLLVVAAGCKALATLYLLFLGVGGESVGPLLWPAGGVHAVLTIWCFAVTLRPAPPAGQTA